MALCPYRMSGGGSGSDDGSGGKAAFALNAIDQWTFRGELMCRCITHYDHAEIMRQLTGQ